MKWALVIFIASFSCFAVAQGTLQNLDFESATLSPLPQSEWGGDVQVPISSALPCWTGYVGAVQQTQVYQDTSSLGQAEIDIFGPDYPAATISPGGNIPGVIDGNFSVLLQPGGEPGNSSVTVNTSIAQTGTVPVGSQSIQFKAWEAGPVQFTVSLSGSVLIPIALGNGANYTVFGANIPSSLDGQSAQLQFTDDFVNSGFSALGLDDISFSTQSVPETSPLLLIGLGGTFFALYRRFAPKRCSRL